MTISPKQLALAKWLELNKYLKTATEQQCSALLDEELCGKSRLQFILRIYGRFNSLRTRRERRELAECAK